MQETPANVGQMGYSGITYTHFDTKSGFCPSVVWERENVMHTEAGL